MSGIIGKKWENLAFTFSIGKDCWGDEWELFPNPYSIGPIQLAIPTDDCLCLTAEQARQLATKLLEAADAVDKAGRTMDASNAAKG